MVIVTGIKSVVTNIKMTIFLSIYYSTLILAQTMTRLNDVIEYQPQKLIIPEFPKHDPSNSGAGGAGPPPPRPRAGRLAGRPREQLPRATL